VKSVKKYPKREPEHTGADFFEHLWEKSLTYIKTVVDVVHEPVLILDEHLTVLAANESFCKTFHVKTKDTQGKIVYELGNGQWNIPSLRKLLEDVLPKSTFFKGFQVAHDFPFIGRKVMILNAREIHFKEEKIFQPIILLAMEDVTEMMVVAETLASHAKEIEAKLTARTQRLEIHIENLEKEINELQKKY
jgi:two-component system cell cycle sensor histidine kinase PleC